MKTKLLKKVRKRYSIYRVDYISESDKNDLLENVCEVPEVPFYLLKEKWFGLVLNVGVKKEYKHAYKLLIEWINIDYKRKTKTQLTKVWYK